jgi:predicted PurR-regulated permease PerM
MSSPRERLGLVPGRRGDELATFAWKVAIVIGFVLLMVALWRVRRVVVLVLVASVIAAGIAPAVRRVQILGRVYLHRRIARGTAVVLVYFPFLLLFGLLVALTVPKLVADARNLVQELPPLIDQKILKPIEKYLAVGEAREMIYGRGREALADLPILGYVRGAVGVVVSVVAVLFMIIYMLIDAERLRNLFLLFYPPEERAEKRRIIRRMSRRMSSWLSGQLLLAAIVGTATFVALVALRIPYALPLALLAGIGEMVPVIGPILGAIPALGVAIFQSNWQFWAVLAMAILIQQLENYLLVPRIMGKKVSISPLAVFIAFLSGATLLGIIGAILAVPMAAVIQVAFEEGFLRERERRQDADRPGSLVSRAPD